MLLSPCVPVCVSLAQPVEMVEVWNEVESELDIVIEGEPSVEMRTIASNSTEHVFVSWLTIILLRLQACYYISDSAIECLLKFMCVFFAVLSQFSDKVKDIAKLLPRSMYTLKHFLGYSDWFGKLAVCSVCNAVYKTENCTERPGVRKLCRHQEFPNSQRCNSPLLKTVELASGKNYYIQSKYTVIKAFKIGCKV